MTTNEKQIKGLFQAFREKDDSAFYRTAESIIARELAANHHSFATDLKQSLGTRQELMKKTATQTGLTLVPKDRRSGEDLITLKQSVVDQTKIVLGKENNAQIERILSEHRNRLHLARFGYSPKTKILFWGPPGCGKTFTAHYLAHELGLPVGVLRLSVVISSYLGDTASHLQRVFDTASNTPMVLLLDEVDAVGKNRDDRNDVGELKRVVNSLLQAIDSFSSTQSIIIAASNHQYLLDSALWRRFDDVVHFGLPGKIERERYLQILLSGVRFDGGISQLSKGMNAFSYADIERVTIEAIKTMILDKRDSIQSKDITEQVANFKKAILASKATGETVSDF